MRWFFGRSAVSEMAAPVEKLYTGDPMKMFLAIALGLFTLQSYATEARRQVLWCAAPSGLSAPTSIQFLGSDIENQDLGHVNFMRVDGQHAEFTAQLSGKVTLLSAVDEGSAVKSTYLVPLNFNVPAEQASIKKYIDVAYLCFTYNRK